MTITADIQFTQGPNTDSPGRAVIGTMVDGPVTCASVDSGGVTNRSWSMIDVPPGSATALGVFSTSQVTTFPQPDARGGYLVQLTCSAPGLDPVVKLLTFQVLEASGRMIPPYKAPDTALTFAGQGRGWSPSLEAWLRYVDTIAVSTSSQLNADLVLLSNDSLSGLATRDGVTPTAGMIALAVAQTTPSQNGFWVFASGAFTRPSFYNVDAQVLVGQVTVAKLGTQGAGSSWRLKSGSTIAGSKTYERALVTHFPVRAVQTVALPSSSYSGGVITGAAAMGAVFDGIGPLTTNPLLVGDRVLVNSLGLAATINGVYTVTALGGSSYSLTRATDFDSSSKFVNCQVDVLDGATAGSNYKGTRWYMTTLATVTLDTTPTAWAQMQPKGSQIDLSLPPYNVRDWPSQAAWFNSDFTDYGLAIGKFLYDYAGTNVVGILPSANGGVVVCRTQFDHFGGATIRGASREASQIAPYSANLSGGHVCIAQNLPNPSGGNGFPGIGGTLVDSGGDSPLSFWRDSSGATGTKIFYNLSFAGLLIDDWTQFECRYLYRFESLSDPAAAGNTHEISCRGRGIDNTATSLFYIFWTVATKKFTALLRLTDVTKGAYAAAVHTGTGTSVVTGDGTTKPTEDAPNFTVKVIAGGTIGVAGCVVAYAVDGIRFGVPIALGTATSLSTIALEVNEHDQPFAAKVNFAAGTLVAGDTYVVPCSGVNTVITSTSNTVVDTTHNYEILLSYDGTNVRFQVSIADGSTARDTGITTAATGIVRQRFWESTIIGSGMNPGAGPGALIDTQHSIGWLGSIRFLSSNVGVPSGPAATTIAAGVSGQKLRWQPKASQLRKDAGGVFSRAYLAESEVNLCYVVPQSPATGPQLTGGGFENLSFVAFNAPSIRSGGILSQAWLNRRFINLGFVSGLNGWNNIGPDFNSVDESLHFNVGMSHNAANGAGFAMSWFQGGLCAHGSWQFQNSSSACYLLGSVLSINASGTIFMNGEQHTTRCPMWLDLCENSNLTNWLVDAENQASLPTGREMMRINVVANNTVKIGGTVTCASSYGVITNTGSSAAGSIELDNLCVNGEQVTPLSAYRSDANPFLVSDNCRFLLGSTSLPLIDRPNKMKRNGGLLGPTVIPDAGPVPSWFLGNALKLKAGTITANRNYPLSTTGMQTGHEYHILVEPQTGGFTTQFTNGGPSAGNLLSTALAAGSEGTYRFRLNENFDLERV